MKKKILSIISIVLILTVAIFALVACKKTPEDDTPSFVENCKEHTWKLTSTTATCLTDGIESYECEKCKFTKTEDVSAYGHNFVAYSYTAPTCKTNGEEVEKCLRCGFENKTTLLVVDHDYQVKSTTPSTCTVKGSQVSECSMCHGTKTEELPLANHDYELISTTQSTCIIQGYNYYECKNCTASKSEQLELAAHKYETKSVEATCFTHGGAREICSVCQDEVITTSTPLLEHNFEADGYCSKCGIFETLFDIDHLNISSSSGMPIVTIRGRLSAKFNDSNKTIPDIYWKDHTVKLTIYMYDSKNEYLEHHTFNSTTIPQEGVNYGKLTIQFVSENGDVFDHYPNAFLIFTDEGDIFSAESRQNCASFNIVLSCEGYQPIVTQPYVVKAT